MFDLVEILLEQNLLARYFPKCSWVTLYAHATILFFGVVLVMFWLYG